VFFNRLDRNSIFDDFDLSGRREAIQQKVILSNLEKDAGDFDKLTQDIDNLVVKMSERENTVSEEVGKMSQMVQTRASNMFLNVINNIKK
jgi:hypothetical protein